MIALFDCNATLERRQYDGGFPKAAENCRTPCNPSLNGLCYLQHVSSKFSQFTHFGILLERLKDKSDFDSLLDGFVDHFIGTREVPLPGQLEAMDPARKLTRRDLLAPRPHLIYRLRREPQSDQITLRARGIELTLPSTMEDAVRFALEHPRYRADDLPVSLSPRDKLTLAGRLLREGLIERVRARTNIYPAGSRVRKSRSLSPRRRESQVESNRRASDEIGESETS